MFKGLASHQSDRLTDSLSCRQNGRCDEHEKINGDTNRKLDFVYAFCGFYVSFCTSQRKVRHCYYTSYKEFPPVSDQDRISSHNIHTISIMQVMWINIWYSPDRRSILGNTIPKVLDTTWGLWPQVLQKTEGTVIPNTDQPWLVSNIFIFF